MGVCIEKICRREAAEKIKERKMLYKQASEKIKYSKTFITLYIKEKVQIYLFYVCMRCVPIGLLNKFGMGEALKCRFALLLLSTFSLYQLCSALVQIS